MIQLVQQLIISSSVCIYISWYVHLLFNVCSQILPNKNPKKPQLSVKVTDENSDSSPILTHCRSRYGKFVYQKSVLTVRHIRRHVARREREPSRIPAKKLCRLLQKSRKLRKLVRKHIKNNVPRSSRIHRFAYAFSRERKKLLSGRVTFLPQLTKKAKRLQVDSRRRRKQTAASQTSVFHFKSSKNDASPVQKY